MTDAEAAALAMAYLKSLVEDATISSCGTTITIQCGSHNTKDGLLNYLTGVIDIPGDAEGGVEMAEWAIDFHSSCQKQEDGSLTVMIQISGLPDLEAANKVSLWMRDIIQENAHKIGRRDVAPAVQ